jgi:hypothetical protein
MHLARSPIDLIGYSGEEGGVKSLWFVAERSVEEAFSVKTNNAVERGSVEEKEVV